MFFIPTLFFYSDPVLYRDSIKLLASFAALMGARIPCVGDESSDEPVFGLIVFVSDLLMSQNINPIIACMIIKLINPKPCFSLSLR